MRKQTDWERDARAGTANQTQQSCILSIVLQLLYSTAKGVCKECVLELLVVSGLGRIIGTDQQWEILRVIINQRAA